MPPALTRENLSQSRLDVSRHKCRVSRKKANDARDAALQFFVAERQSTQDGLRHRELALLSSQAPTDDDAPRMWYTAAPPAPLPDPLDRSPFQEVRWHSGPSASDRSAMPRQSTSIARSGTDDLASPQVGLARTILCSQSQARSTVYATTMQSLHGRPPEEATASGREPFQPTSDTLFFKAAATQRRGPTRRVARAGLLSTLESSRCDNDPPYRPLESTKQDLCSGCHVLRAQLEREEVWRREEELAVQEKMDARLCNYLQLDERLSPDEGLAQARVRDLDSQLGHGPARGMVMGGTPMPPGMETRYHLICMPTTMYATENQGWVRHRKRNGYV